jgi:hypothetical protein
MLVSKKVATQVSPRTLASRRNGALGGKARAAKLSKQRLTEIATSGGKSTLAKHGSEFYSHANSLSKTVGRYRTPRTIVASI